MTSDAPHWLFFTVLAVGLSAYLACGLLVLGARARRRWHQRQPRRQPLPSRIEVTS